jgi:hypothetical protein
MKGLAAFAVVALAMVLASPASAAPSATVTNPIAYPGWTSGHVDNISVTMDRCGTDGNSSCTWYAIYGLMAASISNICPQDWNNGVMMSESGFGGQQSANGTVNSGPLDLYPNGTNGIRLCVWIGQTLNGPATLGFSSVLLNSPLLALDSDRDDVPDSADACPQVAAPGTANGCPPDQDGDGVPDATDQCPTQPAATPNGCPLAVAAPPAPPPQSSPVPAVVLTRVSAKQQAGAALAKRFGRAWRRGKNRKLSCSALSPTTFECPTSWTFGRSRYAGRVIVATDGAHVTTTVRVRKATK